MDFIFPAFLSVSTTAEHLLVFLFLFQVKQLVLVA